MIIPIISQLSPDAPPVSRSNLEVPVDHPMAPLTAPWHGLGAAKGLPRGQFHQPNNLHFDLGKMMNIWWKFAIQMKLCHTMSLGISGCLRGFFRCNHWGHDVHPCWTWFAKLKHHTEKHRYYGPISSNMFIYIYMTIFYMHAALLVYIYI